MKLVIKRIMGEQQIELEVTDTTTIGDVRQECINKFGWVRLDAFYLAHKRGLVIATNDDDDQLIIPHLLYFKILEEPIPSEITTYFSLALGGPYRTAQRVGTGVLSSKRAAELEDTEEKFDLASPISSCLIGGRERVMKIYDRYYTLTEALAYCSQEKAKLDHNPYYVPIDPFRRPLPKHLIRAMRDRGVGERLIEGDLFDAELDATKEYTDKIKKLNQSGGTTLRPRR